MPQEAGSNYHEMQAVQQETKRQHAAIKMRYTPCSKKLNGGIGSIRTSSMAWTIEPKSSKPSIKMSYTQAPRNRKVATSIMMSCMPCINKWKHSKRSITMSYGQGAGVTKGIGVACR